MGFVAEDFERNEGRSIVNFGGMQKGLFLTHLLALTSTSESESETESETFIRTHGQSSVAYKLSRHFAAFIFAL